MKEKLVITVTPETSIVLTGVMAEGLTGVPAGVQDSAAGFAIQLFYTLMDLPSATKKQAEFLNDIKAWMDKIQEQRLEIIAKDKKTPDQEAEGKGKKRITGDFTNP